MEREIASEVEHFTEPPPFFVRWLRDGSTFQLTRFAVLRLLGVVYLVAFASAFVQAPALVGEHGLVPTTSDASLHIACAVGIALALAVVLGVTNAGVMLVLWILQQFLCHVGRIFWGYGWELQLCETGLLGALMCPLRGWRPFAAAGPPTASIWLLRWLVVRIMLGAGLIKLRGDPCWRELTCLVWHYETQPNPNPFSALLHHMPRWFQEGGVLFNHVTELVAPFFVVGPRSLRRVAGVFFVVFQSILIASGNLAFLNWLTIVPALACFDDDLLLRLVPQRLRQRLPPRRDPSRAHRLVALVYAGLVALLSIGPTLNLLSSRQAMNMSFEPLHLVNTYGAFGSVTRERDEIILEGSEDAETWKAYELPCKPGDVARRPCLVSPWHYRLDWQMWFAAMASYEEEPWIAELAYKMLRGDRAIEPLLAKDPFPDHPPRFVRAELYRYELLPWGSGPWWKRTYLREYMRAMTKDDPELHAFLREYGLPE